MSSFIKNDKDFVMLYHTVIRNMGLYTATGVGVLMATSRFYKDKNKVYHISYNIIALCVILLAITYGVFTIKDTEQYIYNNDSFSSKYIKYVILIKSMISLCIFIFIKLLFTFINNLSIF